MALEFHLTDLPSTWRWAIALWLAVLGGCVGSFLNVVVYRLPAGKSLVRPGSHCPKCGHAIRWYDNVPVIGWFLLGGHCRDCREPISFRYPLVEVITAAIFFGLAWIELLSDGANLPVLQVTEHSKGPLLARSWMTSELVGVYAFHLVLLCTLLSAALIRYDRQRIPLRLFVGAVFIGAIATLFWPVLRPNIMIVYQYGASLERIDCARHCDWSFRWTDALFQAMGGLVVGAVLGCLGRNASHRETATAGGGGCQKETIGPSRCAGSRFDDAVVLTSLCVSFFLGYGVVLVLGAVVLLLTLPAKAARRLCPALPAVDPLIGLVALVPIWIVFWRQWAAMCTRLIG